MPVTTGNDPGYNITHRLLVSNQVIQINGGCAMTMLTQSRLDQIRFRPHPREVGAVY